MGCKVHVHEKPDKRGTWAFHSVDGWYLFTSPEHYRTHRCHVKATRSERLSDTVQFLCKNITNPTKTLADKIMVAVSHVSDLIGKTGDGDKADEAMEELERLAEATKVADQNGTLNSDCNENENSAVPRVQTAPDIPTEPLEYRDPDASVTRLITQRMEKNPIQKVDEVQPPRKQVPRVDKSMDAATKTTIGQASEFVGSGYVPLCLVFGITSQLPVIEHLPCGLIHHRHYLFNFVDSSIHFLLDVTHYCLLLCASIGWCCTYSQSDSLCCPVSTRTGRYWTSTFFFALVRVAIGVGVDCLIFSTLGTDCFLCAVTLGTDCFFVAVLGFVALSIALSTLGTCFLCGGSSIG